MNKYVYIETLGCSKNQVDSEVMMGLFEEQKYFLTDEAEQADILIVNTCGFIESAKAESIETILEMSQFKTQGKAEYLIVTGCLAERYADALLKEIPEVDAFVGTTKFDEIMQVIGTLAQKGQPIAMTGNIDKVFAENMPRFLSTPQHYAFLKIAEGCDNCCTYCIIPQLRGKYRSRTFEAIVEEAEMLAAKGVKELILIAQDTTRYGIDLYGHYRLADLLKRLNQIPNLKWIRVQYMYPDIINQTLIDTFDKCTKVVNYFDMPIQHASDAILRRMNRNTTNAQIQEVIDSIRKTLPDATIRTTMIVGFPGETQEDAQTLLDFIEKNRFDRLGAFTYSREEDTPAFDMPDQVDEDVKSERHSHLMRIQQDISEEIQAQKIGKQVEVVIEETTEDPLVYVGRTAYDAPEVDGVCYVHRLADQPALQIGDFVSVKIDDAMEFDVMGVLV